MSEISEELLKTLNDAGIPTVQEFEQLLLHFDDQRLLAKLFILEGIPFVFKDSPHKYTVFREQVADRFNIGSQDVCIVGSARLGFSPSAWKFGTTFSEASDVDVVVVSLELFERGSHEVVSYIESLGPPTGHDDRAKNVEVEGYTWNEIKTAIRNIKYRNFNPASLPSDHELHKSIFEKVSSTSGLFCALQPQVFVSKIRARVFASWRAAEDYYANSLRQLRNDLSKSKKTSGGTKGTARSAKASDV